MDLVLSRNLRDRFLFLQHLEHHLGFERRGMMFLLWHDVSSVTLEALQTCLVFGDHYTVVSTPGVSPTSHTVVTAVPSPSGPVHPTFSSAMVQTCIPSSDQYVTLTVATPHPTLQIQIGHMLTTQGAGVPETTVSFSGQPGQVSVTVPTDVVFSLGPTGALFGSVVDTHGALWLLFYVAGPTTVPVLEGPSLSLNQLATWPLTVYTVHAPTIQRVLAAAKHAGWTTLTDVIARRHLTGIGVDGWLRLPLHKPLDIVNPTAGAPLSLRCQQCPRRRPRSTPPSRKIGVRPPPARIYLRHGIRVAAHCTGYQGRSRNIPRRQRGRALWTTSCGRGRCSCVRGPH